MCFKFKIHFNSFFIFDNNFIFWLTILNLRIINSFSFEKLNSSDWIFQIEASLIKKFICFHQTRMFQKISNSSVFKKKISSFQMKPKLSYITFNIDLSLKRIHEDNFHEKMFFFQSFSLSLFFPFYNIEGSKAHSWRSCPIAQFFHVW